ncbi:MAG: DNA polymerase domain-containing protein [Candidatus Muiribacteriota bacterium]
MKGFLFDCYQSKGRLHFWFINSERKRVLISKKFSPSFFVKNTGNINTLLKNLKIKFKKFILFSQSMEKNIYRKKTPVIKIECINPEIFLKITDFIIKTGLSEKFEFYNIELTPLEIYLFENKLFPFGFCEFDNNPDNRIISDDFHESMDYTLPDMKVIKIIPLSEGGSPFRQKYFPQISLNCGDGREYIVEKEEYEYIDDFILSKDPDIIITDFGDQIFMKKFYKLGFKNLNRFKNNPSFSKNESFKSYGKTVFRAGAVYLKGRLHIDRQNSFFYKETGAEGMIELSRISSMPLQKLSRTSPGTVITAIETRKAFEQGILIPFRKNLPEDYKNALQLINSDKGGLSYRPRVGFFENVAELDFFSMYPSIMVNCNLSYETLNCGHKECRKKIQGTSYRVCQKIKGIIPQALEFILKRRKILKDNMKKAETCEKEYYNKRQIALKWLLVVSFGYLGYKNARFGRIECHEATTAMGRELLLEAKDIAEKNNFRMLHGLTDAIWVQKKDACYEDYKKLSLKINKHINKKFPSVFKENSEYQILPEGLYKWIVFLPSKKEKIGVANKYFGIFENNCFKLRGIQLRRRDSPEFIKDFQKKVLQILSEVKTRSEFKKKKRLILNLKNEMKNNLIDGKFSADELAVKKVMGKNPFDYKKRTDISDAAKILLNDGIKVYPGEKLNLIYTDTELCRAFPQELYIKNPTGINIKKYIKILDEAASVFLDI